MKSICIFFVGTLYTFHAKYNNLAQKGIKYNTLKFY